MFPSRMHGMMNEEMLQVSAVQICFFACCSCAELTPVAFEMNCACFMTFSF